LTNRTDNWRIKRRYQYRLLVFGIVLTGFGLYQLPTIFTFKSNLTQIKGTLRDADIYVTTGTNKYGNESRKSELIFYLTGLQQKFYLAEGIGDNRQNEKYKKILNGLRRADTIKVWVRKSEVSEYEPKVFQIDNEKGTLLDFETVRNDKRPMFGFILLLGLGSIAAFVRLCFPDRFNKVFGTSEQTNQN
jgi:hypothetical protein